MNTGLEIIWNEIVVADTSYYTGNFVEELRKIMKKFSTVGVPPRFQPSTCQLQVRTLPLHQHGRKINLFLTSLYGMKHLAEIRPNIFFPQNAN
jgi:hypothetical protein